MLLSEFVSYFQGLCEFSKLFVSMDSDVEKVHGQQKKECS